MPLFKFKSLNFLNCLNSRVVSNNSWKQCHFPFIYQETYSSLSKSCIIFSSLQFPYKNRAINRKAKNLQASYGLSCMTLWIYLTLLNHTLKSGYNGKFYGYFATIKKKKKQPYVQHFKWTRGKGIRINIKTQIGKDKIPVARRPTWHHCTRETARSNQKSERGKNRTTPLPK